MGVPAAPWHAFPQDYPAPALGAPRLDRGATSMTADTTSSDAPAACTASTHTTRIAVQPYWVTHVSASSSGAIQPTYFSRDLGASHSFSARFINCALSSAST
jgi:hypothetical protein